MMEYSQPKSMLRTIFEAAEELRVGRSTVYELIRSKQLETIKIGRCTRVPVQSIIQLIERLRTAGN